MMILCVTSYSTAKFIWTWGLGMKNSFERLPLVFIQHFVLVWYPKHEFENFQECPTSLNVPHFYMSHSFKKNVPHFLMSHIFKCKSNTLNLNQARCVSRQDAKYNLTITDDTASNNTFLLLN